MRSSSLMQGIVIASLASGPLFVAANLLAVPLFVPNPPSGMGSWSLGLTVFLLLPVLLVGFLLGFVPNLVGALAMAALAERHASARPMVAWIAAGAMMGAAIGLAFGADEPLSLFPVIATSAVCAAICRAVGRREIGPG